MLAKLELTVKLQGIDLRAAELRKEIATLPRQIAEIEKTLESHQRKLDADRAVLAGNQKERRQLEGDVQLHQQKISKLKDQMMEAKTNEQYRAFQHEIEYCEQAVRKCEDRILELMLESEVMERNVQAADTALRAEREEVERQKREARERAAADQHQLDEILGERREAVKAIPPDLLSRYELLSKKHHGHAIADASDGRCSACQLELRPQLFQDLRKGDQILVCESCFRILYYNPPADLEAEGAAVTPSGTRVDMT